MFNIGGAVTFSTSLRPNVSQNRFWLFTVARLHKEERYGRAQVRVATEGNL